MHLHTLAECISLACLFEATAPKPGNVHRGADFADLSFLDLTVSGVVVAPHLARAAELGVGAAAWQAMQATQRVIATNSNLGIVLLLAPLAAVPREEPLPAGVQQLLQQLTPQDSLYLWRTIQAAKAGGLGQVPEHDVAGTAPQHILPAMQLAADRDLIAAQYVNGFKHVFEHVVPWLVAGCQQGWSLTTSIIHTHVQMMAEFPDSLIARKRGREVAQQAAHIARQVLQSGPPEDENYQAALADFDFWLRADGHQRNPGTTADMLAAGLFVILRDALVAPPYR
jgi:triphosphoribosyl-dephospho-CoA synthase